MFIHPVLDGILSVVALVWFATQLFKLSKFLYQSFVVSINLSCYKRKVTPWAVVTGASDGIGLGFLQQLAGQGFNVLMTGRNEEKLQKVKNETQERYSNVTIDYIVSNAEDPSEENMNKIADRLRGRCVTLLVNNVGISLGTHPLIELDSSQLLQIINVNCAYPTLLTRTLLPLLEASLNEAGDADRRAAVIHISSVTVDLPFPNLAVYTATKAFNNSLASCLHYEHPRIDQISVRPGLVSSQMTGRQKPDGFVCCSGTDIADSSLRALTCRRRDCVAYPGHAFLLWLICNLLSDKMRLAAGKRDMQKRR